MNELMTEFNDVLTASYQSKTRIDLINIMRRRPMATAAYARAMNLNANTLGQFLRGAKVTYQVISKIDNYIDDQKGK